MTINGTRTDEETGPLSWRELGRGELNVCEMRDEGEEEEQNNKPV